MLVKTEPKRDRTMSLKQDRKLGDSPERKRERLEKPLKIDDTPENVARALWGERSTKFPKNRKNQTQSGA